MPHLADLAAVTPQAMHRTVIELERRGLVHRKRKDDNEKTFFLSLTSKGSQFLKRAEERVKVVQDAAKDQLSQEEIETLQVLLKKYESAFQKK
jgi:DNA-binding MarR family transcriptional regulator